MKVKFTAIFEKIFKKLHNNQKEAVRDAIDEIIANPEIGEMKQSDLAGVRVYKFPVLNKLTLIAYNYVAEKSNECLILLYLGVHENFYRDLKKSLK